MTNLLKNPIESRRRHFFDIHLWNHFGKKHYINVKDVENACKKRLIHFFEGTLVEAFSSASNNSDTSPYEEKSTV